MRCLTLIGVSVLVLASMSVVDARVGETRSAMENRLFRDRKVIAYPDRYIEQKINDRAVPYRNLLSYFPDGCRHAIYFKKDHDAMVARSDLDTAPFPDGWDLHVVFYQDVSVFEAYRRNGQALTEAEVNALLALNREDSHWKRVNRREQPQVFGCDFVLESGKLMSARQGNFLIIYRPGFEEIVRKAFEEFKAEQKEKETELAPESVKGF